jgi:hypothetical protein
LLHVKGEMSNKISTEFILEEFAKGDRRFSLNKKNNNNYILNVCNKCIGRTILIDNVF